MESTETLSLYCGAVLKMYHVFCSTGHMPIQGHHTGWRYTRGTWSRLTWAFASARSATVQHQRDLRSAFTMTLSDIWFYRQWMAWRSQVKGIKTGPCTAGLSFPRRSWEFLEPAEGALALGDSHQPWPPILELPFLTVSINFIRPHSLIPTPTPHKANKQNYLDCPELPLGPQKEF